MLGVLADVCAIEKNQRNKQQDFKFRGIDDVYNELHPLFAKHGILWAPRVTSNQYESRAARSGGSINHVRLMVEYVVSAEDGTTMTVGPVPGEAMDSGDKASSKAMSIAFKSAVFQTFVIPTDSSLDPDGETYEPVAPRERERARDEPSTPGRFAHQGEDIPPPRARPPEDRKPTMADYRAAGDPQPGAAHYNGPPSERKPETSPDGQPTFTTTVSARLKALVNGDKDHATDILEKVFGKPSVQNLTMTELKALSLFIRAYPLCGSDGAATLRWFRSNAGGEEFPRVADAFLAEANRACDEEEAKRAKPAEPVAGLVKPNIKESEIPF